MTARTQRHLTLLCATYAWVSPAMGMWAVDLRGQRELGRLEGVVPWKPHLGPKHAALVRCVDWPLEYHVPYSNVSGVIESNRDSRDGIALVLQPFPVDAPESHSEGVGTCTGREQQRPCLVLPEFVVLTGSL